MGNVIVLGRDATPNALRVERLKEALVSRWIIGNVVTATRPTAVPSLSGVTLSPGIIFRCARLTIVR